MKIHQVFINDTNKLPNDFPEFHNICVKKIKQLYPNSNYHLYSGEEIENIIQKNFDRDVFTAYRKLKPYACKADIARYCLLYLYGGLYIDLNIYFTNRIPNLNAVDFFAFRDTPQMSRRSWAVQNGILYSKPGSKIIENVLNLIIEHCKKEYYGIQCMDVCGTTILGRAITLSEINPRVFTNGQLQWFEISRMSEKIQNKLKKMGYIKNYFSGYIMDDIDDNKIIAIRKPTHAGDIKTLGFNGTNNYVEMWQNRDVYDTSIKFKEKLIFTYR